MSNENAGTEKNSRKKKSRKDIGCIGLGRIGSGIVTNFLKHNFDVAVYDQRAEAGHTLKDEIKSIKGYYERRHRMSDDDMLEVCSTPEDVARRVRTPRIITLFLPAGRAIDAVLDTLAPQLESGDIVIDGGNSHYRDSMRRAAALQEDGIYFLDMGTSGGVYGARYGACLMVGGDESAYMKALPFLGLVTASGGCEHVGPSGAGHFTKMVHNLIEYGMEKCIGEGMALLEAGSARLFGSAVDAAAVSKLWNHGSIIESKLLGYLVKAMKQEELGKKLENISGKIGGGETGEWAVAAAMELKVPVPSCALALAARYQSQETDSLENRCVAAMRYVFGEHEVMYKVK